MTGRLGTGMLLASRRASGSAGPAAVAWNNTYNAVDVTYSNSDQTIDAKSLSSGSKSTRTLTSKSSGKAYVEFIWTIVAGSYPNIGVGNGSWDPAAGSLGGTANSVGAAFGDPSFWMNNAFAGLLPTFVEGARGAMAVNIDTRKLFIKMLGGQWYGLIAGADPVADTNGLDISGITGALYIGGGVRNTGGKQASMTLAGLSGQWQASPPSGFGQW